jgi:FkbM family methyltransferase
MKQLTTLTKLRIAKMLSSFVIGGRKLRGQGNCGIFRRGGLTWSLDLNEGIDLSIYLFGGFEREVFKAYQNILAPGAVVLDIGANIGAHTLPMAALCGERGAVHAFEPTLYAIRKLEENLALNPDLEQQVFVHHALLSNVSNAPVPESVPSSWQLSNAGQIDKHPQHGGSYKKIGDAAVMTIDQFVEESSLQRINLFKLDVDGNEWSVLQGAARTIACFKPIILMEFSLDYNKESFAEILKFLRHMNYSAKRLLGHKALPLELEALRTFIPLNGSINVRLDANASVPD